jgi:hypothetical protein
MSYKQILHEKCLLRCKLYDSFRRTILSRIILASEKMRGKQPFRPNNLMNQASCEGNWHKQEHRLATLFATLLKANEEEVKTEPASIKSVIWTLLRLPEEK